MEIKTVLLAKMPYQLCFLRKIFKAPKLLDGFESSLSITLGILTPLSQQEMKSRVFSEEKDCWIVNSKSASSAISLLKVALPNGFEGKNVSKNVLC